MDKKELSTASQIINFVLNISTWHRINSGYKHKLSMHLQDIIPGFVIEWLAVDNGELSLEGELIDENGKFIRDHSMALKEVKPEYLEKILETLKDIDLFKS